MDNINNRPKFPKRAVITGGMPYGDKELHFGHVGGVFIHADVFARFLRDRIGNDNVIFVSGTDCYGSQIEAKWEIAKKENGFQGTILDFVRSNHDKQKTVLDKYQISLNLFAASALDDAGEVHKEMSKEVFLELYNSGFISVEKTMQFFDDEKGVFLNGRQVTGRCPIQGCKSELAYADECSLGHQYNQDELINPISTLSGKKPSFVEVDNWYFDLVAFRDLLAKRMDLLENEPNCRKNLITVVNEFLKEPQIYVKKEYMETIEGLKSQMPEFTIISEEQKPSDVLSFKNLDDRTAACKILSENEIRFRTGKTLVPFRISGNASWGIPIPEKDGVKDLTFWVWPESLWAPISFTKTYLNSKGNLGTWEDWWKSEDADIYQFIGEDNIYFYAIAEMGIFMALQNKKDIDMPPKDGQMKLPQIVANHHLLFGKKKASSSGEVKPPMASELLNFYTPEQLRMHFANSSLSEKSSGFEPKPFMPKANPSDFDTVLYEGNLLTNVYNRLVRSCFYTAQKYFDTNLPFGEVSKEVSDKSNEVILEYENCMYTYKFDKIFELLNVYLRDANKYWSAKSKAAGDSGDMDAMKQLLVDAFHFVRTAVTLLHPFAPVGCEMIREYLGADENIWNWEFIFEPLYKFVKNPSEHKIKFLEPRIDFFTKHESQFE